MWVKVMDRVGGYDAYLELREDAVAYEDILTVLEGEADAARMRAFQAGGG